MLRFLGSGAHLEAMPKLAEICSDAAMCHTKVQSESIPDIKHVVETFQQNAKFAHVLHPSQWQSELRHAPIGWLLVRKFK